jgi:phosphoribosylanthranilate isomerase
MDATAHPRVKICCIMSEAEARLAVQAGAHAIGLVSHMPSGPGVIRDELIARIAAVTPPAVATFLLTSRQSVTEIIAQHRVVRTSTIQLVDRMESGAYARLRDDLPGIKLVQVIHVTGPSSVAEALAVAPEIDALLLDSGRPDLPVKELGGTGRCHDWSLSRSIREASPKPVFLAGGLNPDNAAEAIAEVGPFGLDVCSGVRTEGRLDPKKLRRFVRAAESGRSRGSTDGQTRGLGSSASEPTVISTTNQGAQPHAREDRLPHRHRGGREHAQADRGVHRPRQYRHQRPQHRADAKPGRLAGAGTKA